MLHFRLHGGGARGLAPLRGLREGRSARLRSRVRIWQGRRFLRFLLHRHEIDVRGSAAFHNHLGRRRRRSPVLRLPGSLGKLLLLGLGEHGWCLVGREGRLVTRRTRVAEGRSVRELDRLLRMGFERAELMLRPSEDTRRVVNVVVSRPAVVGIRKFGFVSPGFVPTVLPEVVDRRRLPAGIRGVLGERRPQPRGVGRALGLRGELAVRVGGVLAAAGIGGVVGERRAAVRGDG